MKPLLAAVAALLLIAPAAEGRIVIQKSIAGVEIGMTATQVRAELGAPRKVGYRPDPVQGSIKVYDYGLTDVFLSRGPAGRVFHVTTKSRRQRTAKGIGVGSTRTAIRRAYAKATCVERICFIGDAGAGEAVTTFHLTMAGRVHTVSLATLND